MRFDFGVPRSLACLVIFLYIVRLKVVKVSFFIVGRLPVLCMDSSLQAQPRESLNGCHACFVIVSKYE